MPHMAARLAGPYRSAVGLVRRVFRRTLAQVDDYAAAWQAHNERALAAGGPLWVVLGDSAAQGVGASSHLSGYVGVVRSRLEQRDGRPWRVVNLSRSGARTREVVDVQWPLAQGLPASLVTAVVGGNDALHTKEPAWRRDAVDLCAALPPGAVVATVARGVFERKTARVNAVLRAEAAARGLRVADLWAHTGPPYRGLYFDGFHPNDAGYLQWADALWEALEGDLS
jgi:lysophospholipase L1-like esterase